jgi:hypothetical protein
MFPDIDEHLRGKCLVNLRSNNGDKEKQKPLVVLHDTHVEQNGKELF